MRAPAILALAASLLACRGPQAGAPAAAQPAAPEAPPEGKALASRACNACHGVDMLAQQRLTPAQWQASVKKMRGWGASLTDAEADVLARWLAESAGPDAGEDRVQAIPAAEAAAALAPTPDGPFAGGDAAVGAIRWTTSCAGCHGTEGKGGSSGPNLTDRPILWRASEFAAAVRRGSAAMPPANLPDLEIAGLLAHLRAARP